MTCIVAVCLQLGLKPKAAIWLARQPFLPLVGPGPCRAWAARPWLRAHSRVPAMRGSTVSSGGCVAVGTAGIKALPGTAAAGPAGAATWLRGNQRSLTAWAACSHPAAHPVPAAPGEACSLQHTRCPSHHHPCGGERAGEGLGSPERRGTHSLRRCAGISQLAWVTGGDVRSAFGCALGSGSTEPHCQRSAASICPQMRCRKACTGSLNKYLPEDSPNWWGSPMSPLPVERMRIRSEALSPVKCPWWISWCQYTPQRQPAESELGACRSLATASAEAAGSLPWCTCYGS